MSYLVEFRVRHLILKEIVCHVCWGLSKLPNFVTLLEILHAYLFIFLISFAGAGENLENTIAAYQQ